MGSMVTLTEAEKHLFYHGLKRLHRALANPKEFEEFVRGGVTKIFVISDEMYTRQFRTLCRKSFPPTVRTVKVQCGGGRKMNRQKVFPHDFMKWISDEMESAKKNRGFMSFATPPGEREGEVRRVFELLRDTLANRAKRKALAEIGPCVLYLWNPTETALEPNDFPSVLVSNFIPKCFPNADYSIVPDDAPVPGKEEYGGPVNGIWFHS